MNETAYKKDKNIENKLNDLMYAVIHKRNESNTHSEKTFYRKLSKELDKIKIMYTK